MAALSEFRDAIKNAAEKAGVPIYRVDPKYTSKTCSTCQDINKDLKSEKQWICNKCGAIHDRDENAANNLVRLGKKHIESEKNTEKSYEISCFFAFFSSQFAVLSHLFRDLCDISLRTLCGEV